MIASGLSTLLRDVGPICRKTGVSVDVPWVSAVFIACVTCFNPCIIRTPWPRVRSRSVVSANGLWRAPDDPPPCFCIGDSVRASPCCGFVSWCGCCMASCFICRVVLRSSRIRPIPWPSAENRLGFDPPMALPMPSMCFCALAFKGTFDSTFSALPPGCFAMSRVTCLSERIADTPCFNEDISPCPWRLASACRCGLAWFTAPLFCLNAAFACGELFIALRSAFSTFTGLFGLTPPAGTRICAAIRIATGFCTALCFGVPDMSCLLDARASV